MVPQPTQSLSKKKKKGGVILAPTSKSLVPAIFGDSILINQSLVP